MLNSDFCNFTVLFSKSGGIVQCICSACTEIGLQYNVKLNHNFLSQDEKKQLQLTVLTDRSQGGASIHDGEIELMVCVPLYLGVLLAKS